MCYGNKAIMKDGLSSELRVDKYHYERWAFVKLDLVYNITT